jgi:hypothetical protein
LVLKEDFEDEAVFIPSDVDHDRMADEIGRSKSLLNAPKSLHSARLAMLSHLLSGSSASVCFFQKSRSAFREMTCMSAWHPSQRSDEIM